jgi:LPXTG-motif cell wall-anchored protein
MARLWRLGAAVLLAAVGLVAMGGAPAYAGDHDNDLKINPLRIQLSIKCVDGGIEVSYTARRPDDLHLAANWVMPWGELQGEGTHGPLPMVDGEKKVDDARKGYTVISGTAKIEKPVPNRLVEINIAMYKDAEHDQILGWSQNSQKAPDCAAQQPATGGQTSVVPSASPSASPRAAAPSLPVTGANSAIVAGVATGLVALGALLFLMNRRRRISFRA